MYLCCRGNDTGYIDCEMISRFSMIQKKTPVSLQDCKMEPNRGGRFFDAARCVGGQPVPFAGVEGRDRFDEADRSDGEQILRVFVEVLIFFHDMGYEPQIPFDQDVFCFEAALRVFLDVILFFRGSEGIGK